MNNIKTLSIATDGNMKRLAITYDVIDETGKVIKANKKVNRVVTDAKVLGSIDALEAYANEVIEEM